MSNPWTAAGLREVPLIADNLIIGTPNSGDHWVFDGTNFLVQPAVGEHLVITRLRFSYSSSFNSSGNLLAKVRFAPSQNDKGQDVEAGFASCGISPVQLIPIIGETVQVVSGYGIAAGNIPYANLTLQPMSGRVYVAAPHWYVVNIQNFSNGNTVFFRGAYVPAALADPLDQFYP